MTFRPILISFLAIGLTSLATAKAGKDSPAVKSPEQLRELANPGGAHRELAKYSGKWTAEIRLGSGSGAVTHRGTSEHRMVADGRFLHCEFRTSAQDETATGILTLGFDRRHDAYTIQSIDSWGTYFVTARGKRAADSKKVKLYGKDDDPHMESLGLNKEFAFEMDMANADSLSVKIFMIDTRTPQRREMLMMEYRFKRAK